MADIFKMLRNSLGNTDFANGNTERIHQRHRIMMGTVGGTKARHGDTDDALALKPQFVEGLHRDEQCQRGIESAADAYHGL